MKYVKVFPALSAICIAAILFQVTHGQGSCPEIQSPLDDIYTGTGVVSSTLVPNATLPFGLGDLSAAYTLTSNAFYVASLPLLVTACIKSVAKFTENSVGISLGSAALPAFRVCVFLGVATDPLDGTRMAALNLSNTFLGTCPPNGLVPKFPDQFLVDNYRKTSSASISSCPAYAQGMPPALQGAADTSGSLVPITIPLPVSLEGRTTIDVTGVTQAIFSNALFGKLCVYDVHPLTTAAPNGTVAPPGATATTSWWHIIFGDPVAFQNTSTCALMARVPSASLKGKDDLVAAVGAPGKPCPLIWRGKGVQNVTFPGFYESKANGAMASAISWGMLAATLMAAFITMAILSPAPTL